MPRQIWKFPLHPGGARTVLMPAGAKVLLAREQGDEICVWAEVDPDAKPIPRMFAVYGTGHRIPNDPGTYIGTAVLHDLGEAFHVYVYETTDA